MIDRFRFKDALGAFTRKLRGAEDNCHFRSDILVEVRDKDGKLKSSSFQHNLRTNVGADFWDTNLFKLSTALSGTNTIASVAAATGTAGPNSTATTTYTGTFTNGTNNAYAGFIVTLTGGTTAANNGTYLCVGSSATTLILANPNGVLQSSGTLPVVFGTVTGALTANYIALTTDATAAAAGDTTLASEETTNGLARARATDAHTASASSSLLSFTFTYTGGVSKVIAKVGLFDQLTNGKLILETVLSSTATVNANGDTITINWTINY